MAFTRWDPLQDLLALHERMNRLARADEPGWMPPVDLYETADRYVITAEVSGLSREDIDIQVREGKLVLRGERPPRSSGERFERVERGHGRFARAFVLPKAVEVEGITADLRDGVLTIEVPKAETLRRIDVE
ncbi:MAG: heat shock protein Hsp20 [Acidobacteria bacterium]|nr:heat shock protein Hsp20 [Acidobacteriota bacterium]